MTCIVTFVLTEYDRMMAGERGGRVGNEILVLGWRLPEAEGVVREGSAK